MIRHRNYLEIFRIRKFVSLFSLAILFLPIFLSSQAIADEKCFTSNLNRIAAENVTLQKTLDTEPELLFISSLDANGNEVKISSPNVKRKVAEVALQMNNLQILLCKTEAKDIEVAEDKLTGYSRSAFKHWIDADKNGCNTRAEVLIQEAIVKPKVGPKCKLTGGRWLSTYDGKTITNSSQLDVDHLVPLAEAWRSGAWQWTEAQRQAYANDLDNSEALIAVTLSTNRSKGDKDPSLWMPAKDQCIYIQNWISIKTKYSLTADLQEVEKLNSLVSTCGLNSATEIASVPEVAATPTQSSEPTESAKIITPGAFCSPTGAIGKSSSGLTYTCKTLSTDTRNRWRQ